MAAGPEGCPAYSRCPIFARACGPRRSHSWARYRLLGATDTFTDSNVPFGSSGAVVLTAGAGSDGVVLQPIAHSIVPGGFCSSTPGAVQFQATAQPMDQPSSLPARPLWMQPIALTYFVPS